MPVEQHPIPQDVTGYRFRLVGDMTLKQFLELAGGLVLAIALWGSPLPFFFKYPLAIISALLGVGLAFVPFQGRPLEQVILAFIRSIYSPTIYTWKKTDPVNPIDSFPKVSPPVSASTTNRPTIPTSPLFSITPNTLSGVTLDPGGNILPGVLVEISQGELTVRATKSNKLGQFAFSKPLENGRYKISSEKKDYHFDTYAVQMTGQPTPPVKLQAQT